MNILPKKSWHVRNKDNVARVRRDEAEAAEEERRRGKRAELAEQEARTDFLRQKARRALPGPSCGDAVATSAGPAHVNFFQDVEEGGKGTNRGNKEYEEEKRKEKERQEKALGVLTYLGQSASEAQTRPPWYQEAPTRSKDGEESTKDEKLKGKLDPLCVMEKYLQKKTGEKKKRAENKHKKLKRTREEEEATKPSMERLRQERLKREAAERARAQALLSGKKNPSVPEEEMDDRKRRYNSQFNPQAVRKPRVREEHRRPRD